MRSFLLALDLQNRDLVFSTAYLHLDAGIQGPLKFFRHTDDRLIRLACRWPNSLDAKRRVFKNEHAKRVLDKPVGPVWVALIMGLRE